MIKIYDEIMTYIKAHTDYEVTDIDHFYSNSDERLMVLKTPSEAVETRYMDGSKSGVWQFEVYARSASTVTAQNMLYDLEQLLDLPSGFISDSDIDFLKCKVVSTCALVDVSEENIRTYSSSFELEYYM